MGLAQDVDPNGHSLVTGFVREHCLDCHEGKDSPRGFDLSDFGQRSIDDGSEQWEKSLLRIQSRQMPPPDQHAIEETEFEDVVREMTSALNLRAKSHPFAGDTAALRRMTRTEYQNSIRDLLQLDLEVESLLPPDPSSDGFDNITVDNLSPLLLERYLTTAQRVSRAAVGSSASRPDGTTVRLPADQSQENHVRGLPFGTRGGTIITHHFVHDGEYEFQVRLTRDRDEKVEGLNEPHDLDILIDRQRRHRFSIKPPVGGKDYSTIDRELNVRLRVSAGTHQIGVTFVEKSNSIREIKRQPFDASYNRHRHPRQTPALHEVSIIGPFDKSEASEWTRGSLQLELPPDVSPSSAARRVFSPLLRRAFRREITEADLVSPMRFFELAYSANQSTSKQERYLAGIEAGLTMILVNPNFLLHAQRQPRESQPGEVYALPQDEIAARLASFLWRSVPDDELLDVASEQELSAEARLESETRRMLADAKSESLINSFADQWLYLRNLPTITPDLRQFPSFDNNLREAFAEESKRLVADVIRRDASVLELIRTDHAFLNERLAVHYGIPNVVGSHFRRVTLRPEWNRGGLLRQGSVLMATSYATRTSPTIRGAWVLENILGTPPPPPPPNVPTINETSTGAELSFREQLAKHRSDATCASCHDLIDPVGFALDRYDAVGRWREAIEGIPVDARGSLPDGQIVDGVEALEDGILKRPELFVTSLVKKLMTYALGRPLTHADGPTVRAIVADAAREGYRFSDLVVGITRSTPFVMRTAR
ncbi:MAG: DUF1592 domain-containing protein [Planctomycetota bacterium]